jgi:hypothetical protein
MGRALSAAVALGLLAAGCGHTEVHQAMLRPPEAPSGRPVELYMGDQPLPPRPYYEIAIVQAIGHGDEAHPETVARALTDKAARLGCDAVVRAFIDVGYTRVHGAGVCVKWTAFGPAAPSPALPPDRGGELLRPRSSPAPAPRIEPLPSASPGQGGGR